MSPVTLPPGVSPSRPGPPASSPTPAPTPSPAPHGRPWALWALGFRPFYLLAAAYAALAVPLWALQFGGLAGPAVATVLPGPLWHAHEMLFGFALAVIVGFLFTAGQNWTQQPTPHGRALMALAALWLLARVLAFTPYGWGAAAANVGFAAAAAAGLARPLLRARSRRNYFFVGLLLLLGLASLGVHAVALGAWAWPAAIGLPLALDVLLFVLVVMAGRVVPMFTNNGAPGAAASRHPLLERLALGSVLALLLADLFGLAGPLLAALATVAAAAHLARGWRWQPWATRRVPLLWVLHAAYLWVPVHLGLRATAAAGWTAPSLATHALTAGAVGGLVIGMMTRTARGHTGLPLRADAFDVACYLLVLAAALLRVGLPLLQPSLLLIATGLSAACWSAGFGLFVVCYAPRLCRARVDGRPG